MAISTTAAADLTDLDTEVQEGHIKDAHRERLLALLKPSKCLYKRAYTSI
jgi:hypothetical protein